MVPVASSSSLRCAVLLLLALAAMGCGDYRVDLPGGYQIVKIYRDTYQLVRAGAPGAARSVLVGPSVDRYAVIKGLIVGHVEWRASDPNFDSQERGYFAVRIADGRIEKALSEEQWRRLLANWGVEQAPELHRPTRRGVAPVSWTHKLLGARRPRCRRVTRSTPTSFVDAPPQVGLRTPGWNDSPAPPRKGPDGKPLRPEPVRCKLP